MFEEVAVEPDAVLSEMLNSTVFAIERSESRSTRVKSCELGTAIVFVIVSCSPQMVLKNIPRVIRTAARKKSPTETINRNWLPLTEQKHSLLCQNKWGSLNARAGFSP
jgi:hypothetical protein